jgi:integrase
MIIDHQAKYMGGHVVESGRHETLFRDLVDEILKTVTPYRRPGTQAKQKYYLKRLKDEWGMYPVGRITPLIWETWLKEFRKRSSRSTYFDFQMHMNLAMRYAYSQRYVSHLVVFPNPDPVGRKAGRVFTQEEIAALWDNMNEETRDQFILSLECSMRLREVLHLTWDRVDLKTGVITLRASDVKTGTKTGRGRSFKVTDHALKRLRARAEVTRSKFVFPSPENPNQPANQNKTAWRSAKELAGIKGRARWHDLRHTSISIAILDRGISPVIVSEYAGVSIATIQKVYLHSNAEKTAEVSQKMGIVSQKV